MTLKLSKTQVVDILLEAARLRPLDLAHPEDVALHLTNAIEGAAWGMVAMQKAGLLEWSR